MKIKDQQELNNELINAIKAKNDELAKELIKNGAELNQKDSPELPLVTAIYYNLNLVTALIVRNARINPLYKVFATPLTAAIQTLNTGLIFWPLNEKVDVNPKNCQFSPWNAAINSNEISIVDYLIKTCENFTRRHINMDTRSY